MWQNYWRTLEIAVRSAVPETTLRNNRAQRRWLHGISWAFAKSVQAPSTGLLWERKRGATEPLLLESCYQYHRGELHFTVRRIALCASEATDRRHTWPSWSQICNLRWHSVGRRSPLLQRYALLADGQIMDSTKTRKHTLCRVRRCVCQEKQEDMRHDTGSSDAVRKVGWTCLPRQKQGCDGYRKG